MEQQIEVNGRFYTEKPKREKVVVPPPAKLMSIVNEFCISDPYRNVNKKLEEVAECYDLATEYGLIELKKSKLSYNQRESVKGRFHRKYQEVGLIVPEVEQALEWWNKWLVPKERRRLVEAYQELKKDEGDEYFHKTDTEHITIIWQIYKDEIK